MKRAKKIVATPTVTALEDIWLREATRVAIEQARAVVSSGEINPNVSVGRLGDVEWGWIVSAVLFGWIKTRATHAVDNGVGPANSVRAAGLDPDPWDIGAIDAILWELAESNVVDWSKPLAELSRDEMLLFLNDALTLIRKALAARDQGENLITRRGPGETAREANAAAGGPLLAPDELDDDSSLKVISNASYRFQCVEQIRRSRIYCHQQCAQRLRHCRADARLSRR